MHKIQNLNINEEPALGVESVYIVELIYNNKNANVKQLTHQVKEIELLLLRMRIPEFSILIGQKIKLILFKKMCQSIIIQLT